MNRCYKTIWNPHTRTWCAVSELGKNHSGTSAISSKLIKKLTIAFAVGSVMTGIFIPTAGAYTANVNDGVTVTGETLSGSQYQYVNSGGTTIGTTLENGAGQFVSAGGSAISSVVTDGYLTIYEGGWLTIHCFLTDMYLFTVKPLVQRLIAMVLNRFILVALQLVL